VSLKTTNRVFEGTNYTHENTGAGHSFKSTNTKCESTLKPHISEKSWRIRRSDSHISW